MNNAPYRKTNEIVTKRLNIMLFANEDMAVNLTVKPHCIDFRMLDKSLFGVNMQKLRNYINKQFKHKFTVL